MKLRFTGLLIVAALALSGLYFWVERKDDILTNHNSSNHEGNETIGADKAWRETVLKFHTDAETRLRGPEGWLTVVGLTWLKPGDNTIGSDPKNAVVLPATAPKFLGVISFAKPDENSKSQMKLLTIDGIRIDGVPAAKIGQIVELKDDDPGAGNTEAKPSKIEVGSVTFFLIKRKNGTGVRMRDQNSEARQKFAGRHWFEPDPHFVIEAEWVPFDNPKPFMVPDVIGNINEEKSPGYARFEIEGQKFELHPTTEDDTLFFVFRDATAGKETYGAARFLNTPLPKNNRLTLDFNRAVNPPCAFTHYATCPLPVPENVMKIAVRAGELKPPGSDH